MNTKISMTELENQLNEFLKNVENNSSVSLIENYEENKLRIERQHLSNKPIINPIPNITIGEVFLLDMSNATEETLNGAKSNAIKTYGFYQCICDSITINNYNPKVVMDIRIASIDNFSKIRLEYYIDTFDCNYTLCLYDKDNKKIIKYNRFRIRKLDKTL